jgi:hypothetical protein
LNRWAIAAFFFYPLKSVLVRKIEKKKAPLRKANLTCLFLRFKNVFDKI